MQDRHVIAFAFAVVSGAWCARGWSWWGVVVFIALCGCCAQWPRPTWTWPRTAVACAAAALLASMLSAHAWAELRAPMADDVRGVATLVRDPEPYYGKTRAEAKLNGRHVLLMASGEQQAGLRPLLAGQRVSVSGWTKPLSGMGAPSQRRRHVAAVVIVQQVRFVDGGSRLAQAGNAVRQTIERGASSLSVTQRALLTGLVYGDDRAQSDVVVDDFRAAGLAHLTAVSGQNVVFVLLIAAPLLGRLPLLPRFLGGLGVLAFFGMLTRWEPSVVRAEAMAAVVLLASYLGRSISLWRTLSLGVTLAVLADPFLVGSIGFLLSSGACCGMALLGNALSNLLPGPSWFQRSLGFSMAAQLGVAPVQLAVFGPMPVAALPANVLAEPAAAAVMVWGVVGGLAAGVVGEPMATVIHLPTRLLVDWLAAVAHHGAQTPLGMWTPRRVAVAGSALVMMCWWRKRPSDDLAVTPRELPSRR